MIDKKNVLFDCDRHGIDRYEVLTNRQNDQHHQRSIHPSLLSSLACCGMRTRNANNTSKKTKKCKRASAVCADVQTSELNECFTSFLCKLPSPKKEKRRGGKVTLLSCAFRLREQQNSLLSGGIARAFAHEPTKNQETVVGSCPWDQNNMT